MSSQADKFVNIALAEIGYLEKRSNSQLDSKTANAGSNNYTKYGKWYDNGSLQAQPWCDIFVSWCAEQAGISSIVGHFAYCPSHVNWFKKRGQWYARGAATPQPGWIIFFKNSGSSEACHVGIVQYASRGYVYTIEGNTSGASTLVSNGGGVCNKKYSLTSSYILGYGAPAFSGTSTSTPATPTTGVSNYASVKTWKNGSTDEIVYCDTGRTNKIGSLNPYESCDTFGSTDGSYLVCYKIDGTSHYKAGAVEYAGKTNGGVNGGKTWKNGSTDEIVYCDTGKTKKIGSLNPYESCTCLKKIDGMYLVVYKIDGSSHYKIGFVDYAGGLS